VTSLAYRWFGIGRLPATYAGLAADPRTLQVAEAISMTLRSSHVHVQNRRISHAVGLHSGAVVITPDRLVVSIGRRAAIDGTYGEAEPVNQALTFTADAGGLHLAIDIPQAVPKGTGTMTLEIRMRLSANALAWLGSTDHVMALTSDDILAVTRFG
jgi:hypothetical protein